MPKVSVIIPVYGVEKYIERCANSLFAQTLDSLEFIFIDDCTPDNSIEILNKIVEENRLHIAEMGWTVKIVRMPTNSGLAAVRQHGVQLATGDYVIHCDSDDWVTTDIYERLYNKAIETNADISMCRTCRTDGVIHNFDPYVRFTNDKVKYMNWMLQGKGVSRSLCVKLIKRTLYTDNPFVYPVADMGEDETVSLQAIYYANKYVLINEPLYYYYINPVSITRTINIELIVKRFLGKKANLEIVEKFIYGTPYKTHLMSGLFLEKFNCKFILSSIINEGNIKKLFFSSFPEVSFSRVMMSPYISIKNKLLFLKRTFSLW